MHAMLLHRAIAALIPRLCSRPQRYPVAQVQTTAPDTLMNLPYRLAGRGRLGWRPTTEVDDMMQDAGGGKITRVREY
jgi:hypothetical protein